MPKDTYPKSEIIKRSKAIEKLYNQYADEIARYVKGKKIVYKKPFWKFNPELKKFVSSNLGKMQDNIASEIVKGIENSWKAANAANDEMVIKYIEGFNLPIKIVHSFMQHNNVALSAFLNRSINGLRLSGRVWLTSMKAQKMIEYALASGITEGKSAASISRIMRQSLKNPNSLYRRVKNPETGELELSKPAKSFKPGAGVYRSAYQNSLRLASTEINMALRTSDFVRWNQVPFVIGFDVKLSNAHPKYDICDEMAGRYPKNFNFFGWHPRCYDEESEVYTNEGWKYFKEIRGNEKILSLKKNDKNLEWVSIEKIIVAQYAGKMIHYNSHNLDLMVTPNHQMIYISKDGKGVIKDNKLAENYSKFNGGLYRSSEWVGNSVNECSIGSLYFDSKLYCEFMGYYLSEGSISRKYAVTISQSKSKNVEKYNKIESCLIKMKLKYKATNSGFNFYNKDIWEYVKEFGKSINKHVPNQLMYMNNDLIRIFLDAFRLGDGSTVKGKIIKGRNKGEFISRDELTYSTSSKKLADQLGELILKVGKRPSFRVEKTKGKKVKFKNGTYTINNNQITISERYSKTATDFKKDEVLYKGNIYDLELDKNHIMYIRRNGKCVWGSNCICYAVPILLSKPKFIEYVNTGSIASSNYVKKIPRRATAYMKKITPTIDKAKNKPFFVQQNFKKKNGIYQFN